MNGVQLPVILWYSAVVVYGICCCASLIKLYCVPKLAALLFQTCLIQFVVHGFH